MWSLRSVTKQLGKGIWAPSVNITFRAVDYGSFGTPFKAHAWHTLFYQNSNKSMLFARQQSTSKDPQPPQDQQSTSQPNDPQTQKSPDNHDQNQNQNQNTPTQQDSTKQDEVKPEGETKKEEKSDKSEDQKSTSKDQDKEKEQQTKDDKEKEKEKEEKEKAKAKEKKKKRSDDDEPFTGEIVIDISMLRYLPLALVAGYFLYRYLAGEGGKEVSWAWFEANILSDPDTRSQIDVITVNTTDDYALVTFKDKKKRPIMFSIGSVAAFEQKLEDAQVKLNLAPHQYLHVVYKQTFEWWDYAVPILLLGMLLWGTRHADKLVEMSSGGIAGMKGKLFKREDSKIRFKDVAGLAEAKVEIAEFVDFLKNPGKYTALGAKIPKGALLVGPPGCGKTLLAKAVAGESNVPFYSAGGSDFIELYVGVGASRVRELFATAKKNSPCIIFIDEIDAVGRKRSEWSHDEMEQTLNQLLVEMDGFTTTDNVILLGGTNRLDVLDPALIRPGRFDRIIHIDVPTKLERQQIFMVHLAKLKLKNPFETYAEKLAELTPGFSGADIASCCNEAAVMAARGNKDLIDWPEFDAAIGRIIGGIERKIVISFKERKTVAYHESGHATVSWFLKHADPLLKLSIIPRGKALGYAQYTPEDRNIITQEQLFDRMCVALAGRVAEQVFFGTISTGAQDDLHKVTRMAYAQIAQLGMSPKVGHLAWKRQGDHFRRPYSENTAQVIDDEVRDLVNNALQFTENLIKEKKEIIEKLAETLIKKEMIGQEDLVQILGPRPWGLPPKPEAPTATPPSPPSEPSEPSVVPPTSPTPA